MNVPWFPQLVMDFVGRIVPGASVLLASLVVSSGEFSSVATLLSKAESDKGDLSWVLLLPVLLASYLIGFSLNQIWHWSCAPFIAKRIKKDATESKRVRLEEHNKLLEKLGRPAFPFAPADLPETFVMHDHLRLTLPVEALRLLKLQSEIRLGHSLVVGFAILSVINYIFLVQAYSVSRMICEVLMIAIGLASWRRVIRVETFFTNGVCILWFALVSTNRLFLSASEEKHHE